MILNVRTVLASLLLAAGSLSLAACEKNDPSTNTPAQAARPADPLDAAMVLLIGKLAAGDYTGLKEHSVGALSHDLSEAEFADLSAIVGWLGDLQHKSTTRTDKTHGGGQRWYALQFARGGPLELEISLDASNKLIGFRFDGEGYADAEHGVLAEQWREFKVYDFHYLDANGEYLPPGAPIPGNRVAYELIVGGIEAFVGEHHIKIEKIVFDSSGKEVFHEPIEFDTKFAADACGIPGGVVRGHLEVPGPGKWEMDLIVTDEHAMRDIDYRHKFETVAEPDTTDAGQEAPLPAKAPS
jgi:hypothetical protein